MIEDRKLIKKNVPGISQINYYQVAFRFRFRFSTAAQIQNIYVPTYLFWLYISERYPTPMPIQGKQKHEIKCILTCSHGWSHGWRGSIKKHVLLVAQVA